MSRLPSTVYLATCLGLASAPLAAQPTDPADAAVHRHILPPRAAGELLAHGEVTVLGWDELGALMEKGRAARRAALPADPPSETLRLADLALDARVAPGGADARLAVTLRIETGEKVPRILPLIGSEVSVDEAAAVPESGSPPAHLVPTPEGFGIMLPGAGTWKVSLAGFVPVERQSHLRSFRVQLPPVPGGEARVALPGTGLQVFADPAAGLAPPLEVGGETRLHLGLPPGSPLGVHWFTLDAGLATRSESGGTGLEVLGEKVFATVAQTLVLGNGRMDARVRVALEVFRKPVDRIRIRVEGGVEQLECTLDPTVLERVVELEDGLSLQLKDRRKGALAFDLSYRKQYRLDSDDKPVELTLPRLRVEGAYVERHYDSIARSTNLRIEARTEGRVEALPEGRFQGFRDGPGGEEPLMAYETDDPAGKVVLTVRRYPDAPGVVTQVVDRATATTELAAHGRAATRLELSVRDRSGAPLAVNLPAGAIPTAFWLRRQRLVPPRGKDGSYQLDLREDQGRGDDAIPVVIEYQQPLASGLGHLGGLEVPLAELGAPIMQLDWTVAPPLGHVLHAATRPATVSRGPSRVRLTRFLIPRRDESAPPVTVGLRYMSLQAQALTRALGLGVGIWSGVLICRLLVASLPLATGLGLLIPLALGLWAPEHDAARACARGAIFAVVAGAVVGMFSAVWLWARKRKAARARAASIARRMAEARTRLQQLAAQGAGPVPPAGPPKGGA